MVKAAGSLCNMNCRYCYYLNNESSRKQFMSEESLDKLIRNYFESYNGPVFSIAWHGGEPTLRGLDFYKKAVELEKQYLPKGCQCWNNLQSNGLELNEEWCVFLKENHFDVGISIDGTKLIHDTYRKDQAGNDTYERICENIRMLKRYGIRADLLCTVNSETVKNAYQVYRSLRQLDSGWIQFIPIVNKDEGDVLKKESVNGKQYGDFLCTVFHQWLYQDLGKCNIQLFAEMLNYYNGGKQSICWLQKECGDVMVVEQDGSVYSCDHFVNENHLLGNIGRDCLADLCESETQRAFAAKKIPNDPRCQACRYLGFCNGGCIKDRNRNGENVLCEGLYQVFEEADEPLHRTLELLKENLSAAEVMEILKQERREKWRDVKGNDPCPCGSGRKYKHCCGR